MTVRLGVDLGGTKIEIIALDPEGRALLRERVSTPKSGYRDTIEAVCLLIRAAEAKLGQRGSVGVGIPGTISLKTGLVKNANSTALIGHPLDSDLSAALGRPVRVANDANCFALSEATDGAAAGSRIVFGIIAGTGVGGGVCVEGKVLLGAHAIAGEWGHNPLPAPHRDEISGPLCYCGRRGCIETWCSGSALATLFAEATGRRLGAGDIVRSAANGDVQASDTMEAFYDRFARSIASVVNVIDPDTVVIGGGLSNLKELYRELPRRVESYAFSPEGPIRILRNTHGDSSGVRGAAWLWREDDGSAGLG